MSQGHSKQRQERLNNTIGRGISPHIQALAKQLCEFERMEYALEIDLNEELSKPDFAPYHTVFEKFQVPWRTRAGILSRIYPFEDFLSEQGKPIIEYIHGENSKRRSGMTKRDRSEGAFKLSLGIGKQLIQSGSSTEWKAGGAKYARTAVWLYVRQVIVINRKSMHTQSFETIIKAHSRGSTDPWLDKGLIEKVVEGTGVSLEVAVLRIH